MGGVRLKRALTPVRGVVVAVGGVRLASSDSAAAVGAGRRCIGETTRSTATAVIGIRIEVRFAAVARVAVAIVVARHTAWGTFAGRATDLAMVILASIGATAAMGGAAVQVGLATVNNVAVAVIIT